MHRWYIPGREPAIMYIDVPSRNFFCMDCGLHKPEFIKQRKEKEAAARRKREANFAAKEARLKQNWIYNNDSLR